ncbi:hypothetical protein LTR41_011658 [Exophiala xenobiotica]|nr:hypothetical protein LTR41_011658 [Exophiala xenobiotica]KAK5550490.1 hypothetical protein LTR46_011501 [Exophiala xenobiotica]
MARLQASENEGPVDATQPIFTVPFQRNPYFVPRHDILSQIETAVYESGTVVLCGPSGTGKSQIAIELPALGTYPLNISEILDNWIQSEDVASGHEPWLMIWDDLLLGPGAEESCRGKRPLVERSAQALSSFHKLFNRSTSRHGALMVTARSLGDSTSIDSDKTHVKVGSFSREQSQQLLRVRRPDAWGEPQSSEAISFMLNHPRSWAQSTLKAWNAVFRLLRGHGRQAVDLLSVISLLDSQHIPIFLLATAETRTANVVAAIATMLRYSVFVVEREHG